MRLADVRTGSFVAVTLLAGLIRPAESAPIASKLQYRTTGGVESTGVEGRHVVHFEGVDAGTLTTGGTSFDLGHFVVSSASADGSSTTYRGTPFEVAFTASGVDGVPSAEARPVTLQGWLHGTVTGLDVSKLSALMIVDQNLDREPYPSFLPPFQVGDLRAYLASAPLPSGGPSTPGASGSIPLRSVLYAVEVVPEPGPLALFAGLLGAVALRRLRG